MTWASRQSNFALGVDPNNRTTDYQARYQQPANTGDQATRKEIKKKMENDAVHLSGPSPVPNPATGSQFRNTFSESKKMNTGLDPFADANIKGTHFRIGSGPMSNVTENLAKFQRTGVEGR